MGRDEETLDTIGQLGAGVGNEGEWAVMRVTPPIPLVKGGTPMVFSETGGRGGGSWTPG